MRLAGFDSEGFLRDYWQKKPLLIRNPWTSWTNPLEPDELAGLACEREVESRLITQTGGSWHLEHGPFTERRFGELEGKLWTLLVQAVDHHVPPVAALLDLFRFIPNWRVDDVMVSYAVDGGGVGPHFDQYDVLLVQGLGKRRWQLGGPCGPDTELMLHDDLRLLADFDPAEEWTLEPGDILYVPPGIAHNGIAASDDCMTYSIGFRAPSRGELISGWAEALADSLGDDDRYADPDLRGQENAGEIPREAIARLYGMMAERLLNRDTFAQWFGRFSTAPKRPELDWRPEEAFEAEDVRQMLAGGAVLIRNPASRFSFIRQESASTLLFVDGQDFACTGETALFAERLAGYDRVDAHPDEIASAAVLELIVALFNQGSVAFEQDD